MAGPIVGGSGPNERINNKVKTLGFNIRITAVNGTPTVAVVRPPTQSGEAALVMADGAGAIVTAATFDVTVTGAYPKLGLEWKDTTVTAAAELIGAFGAVVATSGSGNVALGDSVWAGPADLLLATPGVGMGIYFHIGNGNVSTATNALPAKIDQAAGTIDLFLLVSYIDD